MIKNYVMGYQYYGYDLEYYMVVIPIVLLSFFISQRLKYKMTKYSKQNLSINLEGFILKSAVVVPLELRLALPVLVLLFLLQP